MLLTAATQQPDGRLLPPPDTHGAKMSRVRKAAVRLIILNPAVEQPVSDKAASWRIANGTMYGVIITDAGRQHVAALPALNDVPVPSPVKHLTKNDTVVDLLARPDGVSADEIMAATGRLAQLGLRLEHGRDR